MSLPDMHVYLELPAENQGNVHIHFVSGNTQDPTFQTEVLTRLASMELSMSAVSDALDAVKTQISGLSGRIVEDVNHLRDIIAQMAATAVDDQATIASLQADADSTVSGLTDVAAQMAAIDPVSDFPVLADPPVDPPVEEVPAGE